jgi:hypothetical protein
MPFCETGTVTAVGRELRIHELTTTNQVEVAIREGYSFYRNVRTPLVATVWSDAQGFFQVALPVGEYSLFAVEDSVLYARTLGGDGQIGQVSVRSGKVSEVQFDITYRMAE